MEYPIELYHKKSRLIGLAICLFITSFVLGFLLYIILSEPRYDMSEGFLNRKSLGPAMDLESIAVYIILTIGTIFTFAMAFTIMRLAYYGGPFIKIDTKGIDLFIPIKLHYLRVNWSDITSVEFYERQVRHTKIKAVNLILKDTRILKNGVIIDRLKSSNPISDITYDTFQNKVSLNYNGPSTGYSHEEFFEFIKSEFLKYQLNPNNFKPDSGRLFGHTENNRLRA